MKIVHIALVVDDYDEAITFYTQRLGFQLIEDTRLNEHKRWVLVAPSNTEGGTAILLAKASGEEQRSRIGNQTGGRVFLFLETQDFHADYERFIQNGVQFVRPPTIEPYGKVAVFSDLYGNLWDLIEYNK